MVVFKTWSETWIVVNEDDELDEGQSTILSTWFIVKEVLEFEASEGR